MPEFDDILNELRGQFYRSAAERFARIEQALQALETMPPDAPDAVSTLRELMRQFHGLNGAGRTFGFPNVSVIAREAEVECNRRLEQSQPPAPDELQRWRESLAELRQEVTPPANE